MRIALYGGTFDPVHQAHLVIAGEALRAMDLARVLFIPAAEPPHKSGCARAPYEDRYRMVELACAGKPRFEPSRLEAGAGRSYSIDTIGKARAALGPECELFFLIGADAFAEIETWHRWGEVIGAVEFIVVSRPGHVYTSPAGARVHRLESVELHISSSEIRRKLALGEWDVPVPAPVVGYIRERGLYRSFGESSPQHRHCR